MLYIPARGNTILGENVGAASAEFGTTVTGAAAHVKNTTYTTVIAAITYDTFGITIMLAGTSDTASINTRMLVDIAIGAAAAEKVIIPNLMVGNVGVFGGVAYGNCQIYYFPIFIPKGSRLSATAQSLIVNDTCTCAVWLHQGPSARDRWMGSRVTSYGADLATSSGVSHSPGNGAYATATEIITACTYPIKAMQIGYDLLTDTTAANSRGLVRIGVGATPNYVVSDLPFNESTTVESVSIAYGNFILSQMRFNIAAATRLTVSAQRSVSAEARGWIIYGVD